MTKTNNVSELRKGNWIQTRFGRRIYFEDLQPEDIHLDDLAWSLSQMCRYVGHTTSLYTVGQHSILASKLCLPQHAMIGLLHDASEYILGDVSGPLKAYLPDYRLFEKRVEAVIDERFNLGGLLIDKPEDVRRADQILLATEKRDLMAKSDFPWSLEEDPMNDKIVPMTCEETYKLFLQRYDTLKCYEMSP